MAVKKSIRIQQEIEKMEGKIANYQSKLADLKKEKIDAENSEMITMVRDLNCKPNELQGILKAIKNGDLDYLLQHMDNEEKTA